MGAEDRRARFAHLRSIAEELRAEFAHYRGRYRAGEFTRDEILPTLRAITREMRAVATEARLHRPR